MKKSLPVFTLFFLLALNVNGQKTKQYSFTHYSTTGGLAANEVFSSVQDDQGYIWIGTNNGLQRFDGIRYKTFRNVKNNPATIPNNTVVHILLDKKNNLWILTNDGKVGIFNIRKFTYSEVKVKLRDPAAIRFDRKIYEDEDGNVMVLYANNQLVTYNADKNELSSDHNVIKLPEDWMYVDILQVPGTKKYYIGRREGIAVYNKATNKVSYDGHNVENEAIVEAFGKVPVPNNFLVDKKKRVWFETWIGTPVIYCFDLVNNKKILEEYNLQKVVYGYHETRGFLQQRDGTIWVKGLSIFGQYLENENKFIAVRNGYEGEQSIDYSRVNYLFEDKEANVWVGTNNNGVYRFNPAAQFFTNIRHINKIKNTPGDGSMMAFILTKQGTLFAGAWGDGLYHYDKEFNMIPNNIRGFDEKHAPYAWSLSYSRDSNYIWMGSQPGLFRINTKTRNSEYFNPPAIGNRTVRQALEDMNGDLWIGTQSYGLFKWDAKKGKKKFDDGIRQIKDIPNNGQIAKLTLDSQGWMWVSSNGYGCYVYESGTDKLLLHFGTNEPTERKLISDNISSVLQYNDSTIVIGANGLHFYSLKQKKIVKVISMPESVPTLLSAIEKDRNGYLWLSSTNGIFRVNPQNEIFIHFDRIDGIANDLFILAASYVYPDGRIIFGADNQMVIFDPMLVKINDPAPDVAITDFKLMNDYLQVDSLMNKERVELSPEDNSISIEFSGLRYDGTYIIKYMLEGLDKEWKVADFNQQAIYSYLPPGTYTFMLQSQDAEGHPSKNITKMVIRVKPPFWKTWWFLGLVVFAGIAVLYLFDRFRMQKIRAMESVRTRIATSLTEDMTNSISSINISSELAKTKIDTDKERTREYINQISDTSNRMVQAMYDMVWSIDPGNDTMADTIERMKSFAAETESAYPINIDFDIDPQVEKLGLNMDHRYELLSIFKEALQNSARHSGGRYVKISIRYNKPKLLMMIIDDGKGFMMDDAAMLGRGISEMRRRATVINASIYIESEINTGTVVKLEISHL